MGGNGGGGGIGGLHRAEGGGKLLFCGAWGLLTYEGEGDSSVSIVRLPSQGEDGVRIVCTEIGEESGQLHWK